MIKLTLTEEQASIVSKACEFFARVKAGQFGEIPWHCCSIGRLAENRDELTNAWLALRDLIYPDLHGAGHSYGIGKFKDADMAYDVHQAIRYVMFGTAPFSYNKLPECERCEPDEYTV